MQTGLKRDTIDKYYTKPSVVAMCIQAIQQYVQIGANDVVMEPSAGNGAFIEGIKEISPKHIFYDLAPEHRDIIKKDYLTFNPRYLVDHFSNIHVIGNPPFGRQSSMSKKFIKKSCEYCHSISFILPKSFKKDSMKKAFALSFHLLYEADLPINSFSIDGKEHDVPCIFQIWKRKDYDREKIVNYKPLYFSFVKKEEIPDLSIRRVGVYAGKIDYGENIYDKNIQTHYFIKLNENINVKMEMIDALNNISYEKNNTVGPRSICKQEIIMNLNEIIYQFV